MTRFIAAMIVIAWPCLVNADPQYFRVTGVASDDTLNIRAEPDGGSEDIGDLAHDARGVEITATDASGKWGRIIWFEGDGWVAMRYLEPDAVALIEGSALPVGLSCGGTEPFWDITYSATGAHYSSSSVEGIDLALIGAQTAVARIGFPELLIHEQGARRMQSLIRPAEECSDGMSDRSYPYSMELLLDGGMAGFLGGCCYLPLQ